MVKVITHKLESYLFIKTSIFYKQILENYFLTKRNLNTISLKHMQKKKI